MIISQSLDSNIIAAHGRNVIVIEQAIGDVEVSAFMSGLSGTMNFIRKHYNGRLELDLSTITKQVYSKVSDYVDPFAYGVNELYDSNSSYHFASLSIQLYDGFSQLNLSYRVLNCSQKFEDATLDTYIGAVLSHLPCDGIIDTGNQPPIAFDDTFVAEVGDTILGNLLDANPLNEDYDPDADIITVNSITYNGINYPTPVDIVLQTIGTLRVSINGDLEIELNSIFVGNFIFDYTISDSQTGIDAATVYVRVNENGIYRNQYQNQYQ